MRQWVLCATVLALGCTEADAPPSISVTPILSIGSLDAPAPEVFGEVTDIVVDEAGRIAVLDRLSKEIRLFDAEGAFLGSAGQPGEGPGEYLEPMDLESYESGLLVLDVGNQRLSRLALSDRGLTFEEDWPLEAPAQGLCVHDGDLFAVGRWQGKKVHRFATSSAGLDHLSSAGEFWSDHELVAVYETFAKVDCTPDHVIIASELLLTVEFVGEEGHSAPVSLEGLEAIVMDAGVGSLRFSMREDGPGYIHRITGAFAYRNGALVSVHRESTDGLDPDGDLWYVEPGQTPLHAGSIPLVPLIMTEGRFYGTAVDPFPRVVVAAFE